MNKIEKLHELQASVVVRQQEIQQLVHRRTELLEELGSGMNLNEGPSSSGASRSKRLLTSIPAEAMKDASFRPFDALFTAAHPVLERYVTGKDLVRPSRVPPEQLGNVTEQLVAVEKGLSSFNKMLVQTNADMQREITKSTVDTERLQKQIQLLSELSGLKLAPANEGKGNAKQPASTNQRSRAPAAAFQSAPTAKENEQLRFELLRLQKEKRMTDDLARRNEKVMQTLQAQLAARKTLHEKIGEQANRLRCLRRDAQERKTVLQRLLVEHEGLDTKLTIAMTPTGATSLMILDRDVTDLRRQVEDCVEGQRRVQDRVIKAQDFRIQQLERRLTAVRRGVQNRRLDRDVAKIVNSLQASDATVTTSSEVPLDIQELYDVDKILPADETVHPAIFSLLAEEKENLALRVHQYNTMLEEKDAAAEAVAHKIAELIEQYEEAKCLMSLTTTECKLEEDLCRQRAEGDVQQQREHYTELLREKTNLRKAQHQNHASRATSLEQSEGSRKSRSQHRDPSHESTAAAPPSPRPLEGANGTSPVIKVGEETKPADV